MRPEGEGMNLAEREKEVLKSMIGIQEPRVPKCRLMLSADVPEVELAWTGRTPEVMSGVLAFQSIEQIEEPRGEIGKEAACLFGAENDGRQGGGRTNELFLKKWNDKIDSWALGINFTDAGGSPASPKVAKSAKRTLARPSATAGGRAMEPTRTTASDSPTSDTSTKGKAPTRSQSRSTTSSATTLRRWWR